MDTMSAFAMGKANSGKEAMVFDWEKAAKLIKESGATHAEAGLRGDWEYTGGTIFDNGDIVHPEETYVYLASTWAVPEIEINGHLEPCYKMQSETPGWDAHTYWPGEALKVIEGM